MSSNVSPEIISERVAWINATDARKAALVEFCKDFVTSWGAEDFASDDSLFQLLERVCKTREQEEQGREEREAAAQRAAEREAAIRRMNAAAKEAERRIRPVSLEEVAVLASKLNGVHEEPAVQAPASPAGEGRPVFISPPEASKLKAGNTAARVMERARGLYNWIPQSLLDPNDHEGLRALRSLLIVFGIMFLNRRRNEDGQLPSDEYASLQDAKEKVNILNGIFLEAFGLTREDLSDPEYFVSRAAQAKVMTDLPQGLLDLMPGRPDVVCREADSREEQSAVDRAQFDGIVSKLKDAGIRDDKDARRRATVVVQRHHGDLLRYAAGIQIAHEDAGGSDIASLALGILAALDIEEHDLISAVGAERRRREAASRSPVRDCQMRPRPSKKGGDKKENERKPRRNRG
jgi:hypothetical protein